MTSVFLGVNGLALVVGWLVPLDLGVQGSETVGPSLAEGEFVRISPRDPRYFELTDGRPYIPVGFNLVGPPEAKDMERVVAAMADHGVNYCRIWLDQPLWSVEHEQSGQYDAEKAKQLDRFLELCRSRGIRVKMCVEWFRSIVAEPPKPPGERLVSQADAPCRQRRVLPGHDRLSDQRARPSAVQRQAEMVCRPLRRRAGRLRLGTVERNERRARAVASVDAGDAAGIAAAVSENLAVQSLGSFDRDRARDQYRQLCELADNDVLQVHRYLDLGADLPVCHGPVDVLAADAVEELRAFGVRKPIILTETGAVKPKHTGASELYAKDKAGMLLHDMLFAPFFAGAAGTGHVWFWRQAIDQPNHWHHFQRFHRAVEGIDPPAEGFEPVKSRPSAAAGLCAARQAHAAGVVPRSGQRLADRVGTGRPTAGSLGGRTRTYRLGQRAGP